MELYGRIHQLSVSIYTCGPFTLNVRIFVALSHLELNPGVSTWYCKSFNTISSQKYFGKTFVSKSFRSS